MSDQVSGGLKACPFCGSASISACDDTLDFFRCKVCGAQGPHAGMERGVDWNTRARESELERRVRLLEAENRSLRVTLIGIRDYGSQNPGHGHTCGKLAGKALRGAGNEGRE